MRDVSDPTYVAELDEFLESALNELEGIRLRLFDLTNAVAKAPVHELADLSNELMVLFRKLTNLEEGIAELTDHRPVQAVVVFEEVDR
jgi:hypothetical protein